MDQQYEAAELRRLMPIHRDCRLRKAILTAIYACRTQPSRWVSGVQLRDLINERHIEEFESDEHCIGLLRDLTIKGLIKERRRRKKRRRGEAFSLRQLKYRMLAAGLDLHLEAVPPDPLIDDGRVRE